MARQAKAVPAPARAMSTKIGDIYTPTEEHAALRAMVRKFTEDKIEPQALVWNREEKFNLNL